MSQNFNPAKLNKNSKHAQGLYTIINKEKYTSNTPPVYRSSWELDFMRTCDHNPNILEWQCEPFPIPYQCPIDGKMRNYWADFLIRYKDKETGTIKIELIEIKPYKQKFMKEARGKANKRIVAVNQAKWNAAMAFCAQNNIIFRVLTEKELYR